MRKYFRLENLRKEYNRQNYKLLLYCLFAAVLVTVCVEILARRSIDDMLNFLVTKFPTFLYNCLIVYFTMAVALLFRRRLFALMVAGGTWVGVAIADCILLSYRSTPLTAPDIWVLGAIRDIFDKYMNYFELGILMFLIAIAIAAIFYILYRTKKAPMMFFFAFCNLMFTLLILIGATTILQGIGWVQKTTDFHNLPRAYRDNGFCYCFGASLLTGGVEEPEDYSDQTVKEIKNEIILPETSEDTPNLIFVQLESFFDPNYMMNLTFVENPVPNFQKLRENYPSGLLSVPSIGAGTVNTEFEVLTGMNLSHFGVGEYPYMTIVDSACPETIAYNLLQIGYRTHAIHNNNATFYDRDIVYANLSFETFTSMEYMDLDPLTDFTPTQWAKDEVLTQEILKCLNSSEEKDFVFTVSVQPHGRYPTEYLEGYGYLPIEGMEDIERKIGFEYYLAQLQQTDAFVGELVRVLSDFDEKTVVLFYGDHMPSFNIQPEELTYGDEQSTEYVIWANYDISNVKRDLQTYQLSAYVMNLCGIHEGEIFRLHQSHDYASDEDEQFQDALLVLEYDMLDGEHISLDGKLITPTDLSFGVQEILLERIEVDEQGYHIYGKNFTQYSAVSIQGEILPAIFVSSNELLLTNALLTEGEELVIVQLSAADELRVLSQTEPIAFVTEDIENIME